MAFRTRFEVTADPAATFKFLGDASSVAECMPGARVLRERGEGVYGAAMALRGGPISAEFEGEVRVEQNRDTLTGVLDGDAADPGGQSGARAQVRYAVSPVVPSGSAVDIDATIELSGAIGQFDGTEFMRIFSDRLLRQFVEEVAARLDSSRPSRGEAETANPNPRPARIGRLLVASLFSLVVGSASRFRRRKSPCH